MILRKSYFHTFAFGFLAIATCAPVAYAKTLVAIAVASVATIILRSENLAQYKGVKLGLFLALTPGILQAMYYDPFEVLRFVPIILLIMAFPYSGIRVSCAALRIVVASILLWLLTTQMLIALDFAPLLVVRDTWYPIEMNLWNYGSVNSLFFEFKSFRAGGLYYNPNVLAVIVVLFACIYFYLAQEVRLIKQKHESHPTGIQRQLNALDYTIILFSAFGVWLTGSRTALVGVLVLFLFITKGGKGKLAESRFTTVFKQTLVGGFVVYGILESYRYFIEGLLESEESANIKFQILFNYLENASLLQLLFGGTFDHQFDAEYGYWLGSAGFFGLLAVLTFFLVLFQRLPQARPLVLVYILMSVGNSVLYGLLTAAIMIPLVVFGTVAGRDDLSAAMRRSQRAAPNVKSWDN